MAHGLARRDRPARTVAAANVAHPGRGDPPRLYRSSRPNRRPRLPDARISRCCSMMKTRAWWRPTPSKRAITCGRCTRPASLQLDFKPVNATVGYHQPCHLKALEIGSPGESLLRLIPGLSVQAQRAWLLGHGRHVRTVAQELPQQPATGWGLISAMRDGSFQAGTTECSACKMQMEQGTSKPTIHPLKAFGPGLRRHARRGDAADGAQRGIGGHMMVRVRLFAAARELAGQRCARNRRCQPAPRSARLRQELAAAGAVARTSLLRHMLFAIGTDYADDAQPLDDRQRSCLYPAGQRRLGPMVELTHTTIDTCGPAGASQFDGGRRRRAVRGDHTRIHRRAPHGFARL